MQDLSSLAAQLQKEGFDARNLGHVGITLYRNGHGYFFPAEELNRFAPLVALRNFDEILRQRNW